MSRRARSIFAGLTTVTFLSAIGALFWYQDLQYSLPTPRPSGWRAVPVGTAIRLPAPIEALRRSRPGQPLLLHVFNPACPCSRFNLDHLRQLATEFGDEVIFVAVLRDESPEVLGRAFGALKLDIPAYVDTEALADALGVYSTPQAAILDGDARLFYQGNYNLTRYCRDRETEFARLALERLRLGAPPPVFVPAATVAYGCPLPRAGSATRRTAL